MTEYVPLITIIVAVLNGAETIAHCLKSVSQQTYSQKQLIVMDGGSTDGTCGILEACRDSIFHWESKPDQGIYSAWNKALKHATGDWICFLGADDYFWDKYVLANLCPFLLHAEKSGIRVVYGQIARMDAKGTALQAIGKPWHKIRWLMPHGMPLPHPGLMHHRNLFSIHGNFDEHFQIAGDYELLLRELKSGDARYVKGLRTVGCRTGGLADKRFLAGHAEVAQARRKHGFYPISAIWLAVHLRGFLRAKYRRYFPKH